MKSKKRKRSRSWMKELFFIIDLAFSNTRLEGKSVWHPWIPQLGGWLKGAIGHNCQNLPSPMLALPATPCSSLPSPPEHSLDNLTDGGASYLPQYNQEEQWRRKEQLCTDFVLCPLQGITVELIVVVQIHDYSVFPTTTTDCIFPRR